MEGLTFSSSIDKFSDAAREEEDANIFLPSQRLNSVARVTIRRKDNPILSLVIQVIHLIVRTLVYFQHFLRLVPHLSLEEEGRSWIYREIREEG